MTRRRAILKWAATGTVAMIGVGWVASFCWAVDFRIGDFTASITGGEVRADRGLTVAWDGLASDMGGPSTRTWIQFGRAEVAGVRWAPRLSLYDGANWYASIPLWLPFLALSAPCFALWHRHFRDRAAARLGACPKCNYSLTGLAPNSPCPECGGRGGMNTDALKS